MTNFVVDVEADGPAPGIYSMVSIGAIVVEPELNKTFYGQLHPISDNWIPEALAVSGHTREETLTFRDPKYVMIEFASWIKKHSNGKNIFFSDNNGFDWQYTNYYFHRYCGSNPFGFTSQNINSLYKGLVTNFYSSFKHLRKTSHTHHPVDDAKGNAEALLAIEEKFGLKLPK